MHHTFVGNVRASLVTDTSEAAPRTYTTKHGTEATMQTANIGKKTELADKASAEKSTEARTWSAPRGMRAPPTSAQPSTRPAA